MWNTTISHWGVILRLVLMISCLSSGSDHWDAAGTGGSEIHSHAGARSPMGQCKHSILKSFHHSRPSADRDLTGECEAAGGAVEALFSVFSPGWRRVGEWAPAACGWEDQEALQHRAQAQQHHSRSVSHYSKRWSAARLTRALHATLQRGCFHFALKKCAFDVLHTLLQMAGSFFWGCY